VLIWVADPYSPHEEYVLKDCPDTKIFLAKTWYMMTTILCWAQNPSFRICEFQ
jgi:hypothetical protein